MDKLSREQLLWRYKESLILVEELEDKILRQENEIDELKDEIAGLISYDIVSYGSDW